MAAESKYKCFITVQLNTHVYIAVQNVSWRMLVRHIVRYMSTLLRKCGWEVLVVQLFEWELDPTFSYFVPLTDVLPSHHKREGGSHIFSLQPSKPHTTMHPTIWVGGGKMGEGREGALPGEWGQSWSVYTNHTLPYPHPTIPSGANPGGSLGRIPSSPLMVLYVIWYRPL